MSVVAVAVKAKIATVWQAKSKRNTYAQKKVLTVFTQHEKSFDSGTTLLSLAPFVLPSLYLAGLLWPNHCKFYMSPVLRGLAVFLSYYQVD